MKLYFEIADDMVLAKVIALVEQAEKQLLVSEGEDDSHQVQPDEKYYKALAAFLERGGQIVRYYFGSKERFEKCRKSNPSVTYIYVGSMEEYQRAVIVDGKKSMAKIGRQFVFSENPQWINLLRGYFENCRITYLSS